MLKNLCEQLKNLVHNNPELQNGEEYANKLTNENVLAESSRQKHLSRVLCTKQQLISHIHQRVYSISFLTIFLNSKA